MILRLAILLTLLSPALRADELTREELNFFESKIRPVLVRECFGCHSNKAGNVRGGLRLDTKQLMLIGGGTGPAIVPGKPDESWLFNAINHEDFVMPPKRKLAASVIDDFRKWIEMGAPDPRVNSIAEIKSKITEADIQDAKRSFWSYKHPVKSNSPAVENRAWTKTRIDGYVLAKLESAGLPPAVDAEAWQVLRRLSFDLVGLPPSPEEIESFSVKWRQDPDRAIAEVVDRLLAKDQFGERWGRHWLDVVRFAESTGREVNMTYPEAWRYRDYVVDSFNADKPFDRFVQEQIAGDLLPVKTDEQWSKNLVATTFLALGPKNVNEMNRVQFAADVVDEQIDATTRVFLGTSVSCARCHDHKFDPIPQTDYYALAGIFGSMKTYFGNPQSEYGSFSGVQEKQTSTLMILPTDSPSPFAKRLSQSELADLKTQMQSKLGELADLRRQRSGGGNAANLQRQRGIILNSLAQLSAKLAAVDEQGTPKSFSMGVQESEAPADAKLLVRGEIDQAAQTVKRGLPQVLTSSPVSIRSNSSGRLELARWIGSDQNPLTARVMVNRIWQHMIGRPIVTTTENFGASGQPPSHPQLLDYLARRFVESGWSVKSLIREIAVSRVYRMSSTFNKQHHEYDPDNALVWRANPRRLDAEAIRDAMLSISGEIDFERPSASLVAQAGYVRVRNGAVISPRDMAGRGQSGRPQFGGGQGRPGFGGQRRPQGEGQPQGSPRRPFGQGRPGVQGRPNGQGRPQFGVGRPGMRGGQMSGSTQLDMIDAKFRSVYLPIVRDEEPRALAVFDFADSSAISGAREASNTPNQALYMMNNPFVIQQSDAFAKLIAGTNARPYEIVTDAFLLTYGRKPTAGERAATSAFLRRFGGGSEGLSALCQSLFASAEFRFVD